MEQAEEERAQDGLPRGDLDDYIFDEIWEDMELRAEKERED